MRSVDLEHKLKEMGADIVPRRREMFRRALLVVLATQRHDEALLTIEAFAHTKEYTVILPGFGIRQER